MDVAVSGKVSSVNSISVGWLFRAWLCVLLQVGSASIRCSGWEIERFITDVMVHDDAHITVTERLKVDFGGELRHGIFRTIPYRYKRHLKLPMGSTMPLLYNLRIKVRHVTDGFGRGLKYRVSRKNGYIEIRIGDPKVVVSGIQDYVITYDVWRALVKLPAHAASVMRRKWEGSLSVVELYWNATGNEWRVPIGEAIANVMLPNGVDGLDERSVTVAFYTGPYGSAEHKGWVRRSKDCISFGTDRLEPGCGLTISVGMPVDAFSFPSAAQELIWALLDNWHLVVALLAPLIALICMLTMWYRFGRDPYSHLPVAVQYEPPKDLTPAEAGTLVDERADVDDITATVIDLAARGYIRIRELKTTKFLFLADKDYEFTLLKPLADMSVRGRSKGAKRRPSSGVERLDAEAEARAEAFHGVGDEALERHEYLMLVGMFESGDRVLLSQLRNKFYRHLPGIRDALYRTLSKHKRLFYGDPDEVRNRYRCIGIIGAAALCGVVFALSQLLNVDFASMLVAMFGVSSSGAVVWLLAPLMPRKTSLGVEALRYILGFKEFIMRAEKDRLERMASEDPTLFGRILPYAVVLGVVDEWAEKMRDIIRHPPEWYESSDYYAGGFSSTRFIHDIGHAMRTMGSTFTSAPREVSGGGFGGGGSSGGGFGGGGGGAW